MRIAIVGSRDFHNFELVRHFVSTLPRGTTIVSGGARGVDKIAETAARAHKLSVLVHEAKWNRPNGATDKAAGYKRNVLIVRDADLVVAFWDRKSRGTKHTISIAKQQGKPCIIFDKCGTIVIPNEIIQLSLV